MERLQGGCKRSQCWHRNWDPPENLFSTSCLKAGHGIDITAVVLKNKYFAQHQAQLQFNHVMQSSVKAWNDPKIFHDLCTRALLKISPCKLCEKVRQRWASCWQELWIWASKNVSVCGLEFRKFFPGLSALWQGEIFFISQLVQMLAIFRLFSLVWEPWMQPVFFSLKWCIPLRVLLAKLGALRNGEKILKNAAAIVIRTRAGGRRKSPEFSGPFAVV